MNIVNNQIKKVYIHIGLHKTGSTSIQYSLGRSTEKLEKEGYLYPEFTYDREKFNHSIPLDLICSNHLVDYSNILNRYSDEKKIKELLNENYFYQLMKQIDRFEGHSIVMSGENLSTWSEKQILTLKRFIDKYLGKKAELVFIVYVRHPVYWMQSFIPQQVIDGRYTIQQAIENAGLTVSNKYRSSLNKFEKTFPNAEIIVTRFEDAIKYPDGLVNHFLSIIGFDNIEPQKIKLLHVNESKSNEAIQAISELNNKYSFEDRRNIDLQGLLNLPGEKFVLSQEDKNKIWNYSIDDQVWLYSKFNIELYKLKLH